MKKSKQKTTNGIMEETLLNVQVTKHEMENKYPTHGIEGLNIWCGFTLYWLLIILMIH